MGQRYVPRASPELVSGYETAADMAQRRAVECMDSGRAKEAGLWSELMGYCRRMAETRATNDDQYRIVLGMRKRKEPPKSKEELELFETETGLLPMWETENGGIPEWKWAAMELALGYLSPLQRVCFEMKVAGKLSYGDIAKALNTSRTDAQKQVRRARKVFESKVRPTLGHIFKTG